jgi:hypothetical protein
MARFAVFLVSGAVSAAEPDICEFSTTSACQVAHK